MKAIKQKMPRRGSKLKNFFKKNLCFMSHSEIKNNGEKYSLLNILPSEEWVWCP